MCPTMERAAIAVKMETPNELVKRPAHGAVSKVKIFHLPTLKPADP
jgi:hypothetical protein